jgi:uncharacterized membrane protein YfcA
MGVSGAVLFVPFFTIVFPLFAYHLAPVTSVQLSIFIELVGFISSTSAFWYRKLIDFRIAGFALVFVVPTAIIGALLANILPAPVLLIIIGLVLTGFAVFLLREATIAQHSDEIVARRSGALPTRLVEHHDRRGWLYAYVRQNDPVRAGAVSFGGIFQGLVGFGSGETSTVEQVLRGIPIRIASGNAHLIIAGGTFAAAVTHLIVLANEKATFPWNVYVASALGPLVGGQIAGFLAGRLPQDILKNIMGRFLTFIGVICLYRAAPASWHLPVWLLIIALLGFIVSVIVYLLRRFARLRKLALDAARVSGRLTGVSGRLAGTSSSGLLTRVSGRLIGTSSSGTLTGVSSPATPRRTSSGFPCSSCIPRDDDPVAESSTSSRIAGQEEQPAQITEEEKPLE